MDQLVVHSESGVGFMNPQDLKLSSVFGDGQIEFYIIARVI